jgi:hypothetical protein
MRLDRRHIRLRDFDLLLGRPKLRICFRKSSCVCLERRIALVKLTLRKGILLDKLTGTLELKLGIIKKALLPHQRKIGACYAFLCRCDLQFSLVELGIKRSGIQTHQNLPWLHEIAFIHQDLLHPERILGYRIHQLGFDSPVP